MKKQIFSISRITDIEKYIAFVFTHATETSKILKIKKKTQFSWISYTCLENFALLN